MATILHGDSIDLVQTFDTPIDLVVTDPPYAFSGSGQEHEISAAVAVVLRETAKKLVRGSWMLVYAASSYRSINYMVTSVRGILDPVRIGTWVKPKARTKVNTTGWKWASVSVIAFRKGKARKDVPESFVLDYIEAEPVMNGRRAELPPSVAEWSIYPYAIPGGTFLDPFAGSGVLVRCAEQAGMVSYGFELQES